MTNLKGGYVLININDSNIYNACNDALTNGKPILLYEDDNTCYYIDSISKSGDDIILTKGGKTFTITDANVVTETGLVANPLMENIKDRNGHNRFIEDNYECTEITGVEYTYTKWNLSGLILSIVLAFNVANTSVISSGTVVATIELPEWIYDKIYPAWSNFLSWGTLTLLASDNTSQTLSVSLTKESSGLVIRTQGSVTLTADRTGRQVWSLIIDNEN